MRHELSIICAGSFFRRYCCLLLCLLFCFRAGLLSDLISCEASFSSSVFIHIGLVSLCFSVISKSSSGRSISSVGLNGMFKGIVYFSTFTMAMPDDIMPICFAAAYDRSIILRLPHLSVTFTTTLLLFLILVTLSIVPRG